MTENRKFNTDKLRGRIIEICGNQEEFARRIGRDRSTVNLKLNGVRDFTQPEIATICEVLSIREDEIKAYFFTL